MFAQESLPYSNGYADGSIVTTIIPTFLRCETQGKSGGGEELIPNLLIRITAPRKNGESAEAYLIRVGLPSLEEMAQPEKQNYLHQVLDTGHVLLEANTAVTSGAEISQDQLKSLFTDELNIDAEEAEALALKTHDFIEKIKAGDERKPVATGRQGQGNGRTL